MYVCACCLYGVFTTILQCIRFHSHVVWCFLLRFSAYTTFLCRFRTIRCDDTVVILYRLVLMLLWFWLILVYVFILKWFSEHCWDCIYILIVTAIRCSWGSKYCKPPGIPFVVIKFILSYCILSLTVMMTFLCEWLRIFRRFILRKGGIHCI